MNRDLVLTNPPSARFAPVRRMPVGHDGYVGRKEQLSQGVIHRLIIRSKNRDSFTKHRGTVTILTEEHGVS